MTLRALAVWLLLLVTIVTLGAVREGLLVPLLGELGAHQVGTVLACLAVVAVTGATLRWVGPRTRRQALGIGALWVVLALAFELGVFHGLAGVPWSELLADYDLAEGRLLFLLWLAVLLGPPLCFRVRHRNPER